MSYIEQHLKKYGNITTGWADRFYSDRFLNSNQMMCPVPTNTDSFGRNVDPNSRITKLAGCSSALDRVQIEDEQRPKVFSNIFLNPLGIEGYNCISFEEDEDNEYEEEDNMETYISFGGYKSFKNFIPPDSAIIKRNLKRRERQWIRLGQKDLYYKSLSGCL